MPGRFSMRNDWMPHHHGVLAGLEEVVGRMAAWAQPLLDGPHHQDTKDQVQRALAAVHRLVAEVEQVNTTSRIADAARWGAADQAPRPGDHDWM